VDLAYERTGSGEPLVLVHGLGHRRQGWNAVLPRLAAERDVIAVDLPAMGESSAPPVGDPHVMADMLEKLFGELGVERPDVAGNSLGGLIALELAARGAVRSAIALSPAGFWTEAERRYAFAVLLAMRGIAQRLPLPLVERLSRTAAGRTALTSTIYARPATRRPSLSATCGASATSTGPPSTPPARSSAAPGSRRPRPPPVFR
jgi:pimeloyl-ACP methyl ester carboxylesterase